MALPRYQQKFVASKPSSVGQMAQAQALSSLSQSIASFKGIIEQQAVQEAQLKGVKEAEQAFMNDGLNARTLNENTVYGATYNDRMRKLYNQRVKLDAFEASNKIYASFPDDPIGFESGWGNWEKQYLSNVDPGQKTDIAMYFASEKAEKMALVNANNVKKVKEREIATTNETLALNRTKVGNFSREGNFAQSSYYLNKAINDIDLSDIHSPEQKRQMRDDLQFNFISNNYYGTIDRLIEKKQYDNASKVISNLEQTTSDEFSIEQRDEMIANMKRDVFAAIRQDNAGQEQSNRMVHDNFMDAKKSLESGKIPANLNQVRNSNLTDVDRKDLEILSKNFNNIQAFRAMPPAKQSEDLRALETKKVLDAAEQRKLDSYQKIKARTEAMVNKSPIDAAVMQGYAKPDDIQPMKDLSATSMEQLKRRVNVAKIAQYAYGGIPGALTSSEVDLYAKSWPNMGNSDKESLVNGIVSNLPTDIARATLGQLNKTRADSLAVAGNLITLNQSGVAREIFTGNSYIAERLKGVTPFDISTAVNNALGNAISQSQDANAQNGYMDAIRSVYIKRSLDAGKDITEGFDEDILEQVVKDVTGGVFTINDSKVISPKPGMEENDFEDWWDGLTMEKMEGFGGIAGGKTKEDEVSLFESIKDIGKLISVGQGIYRVKVGKHFVFNKDGRPLTIKYEE